MSGYAKTVSTMWVFGVKDVPCLFYTVDAADESRGGKIEGHGERRSEQR